jgi:regulator of RNase E activity RraA
VVPDGRTTIKTITTLEKMVTPNICPKDKPMADILTTYSPHKDMLYSSVLADVLDGLGHRTSCLPPDVRPLKPEWKLFGRAATLSCVTVASEPARPYAIELDCIDALKQGDVLVATTNGHRDSSLWGELLSTACRARGAAGVVLDGLTRDTTKILAMNYPVFAVGISPLDSKGRLDAISRGQPIRIGECVVHPGDYIFGDIDGVVVIPADLADKALPKALEKVTGENQVREELAKGKSVREVFDKYGIL